MHFSSLFGDKFQSSRTQIKVLCHIRENEVISYTVFLCNRVTNLFYLGWTEILESQHQKFHIPRTPTQVSRIADRRFTVWATREAQLITPVYH